MRRLFSINQISRKVGKGLIVAILGIVVAIVSGDKLEAQKWLRVVVDTISGEQADNRSSPSSTDEGRTPRPAPTATGAQTPAVSSAVPAGRTLRGVVSKVADGDTVTLTVNG